MTGRRGARGASARNTDAPDVEAKEASSRSTDSLDIEARGADAHHTDTLDTEVQRTSTNNNGTIGTLARRATARNNSSLDTEARGTMAHHTDTRDPDSSTSESSLTTTIDTTGTTLDDDKELQAIKLSRQTEKIARFESHRDFLTTCIKDKIIPWNFRIEIEPSIGNHDDQFLASWYEKVEKLSLELMADTVKFCNTTMTRAEIEAKAIDRALKATTPAEEYNEIKTVINNYSDQKRQELLRTKRAKHRKLRWNVSNGQRKQKQQQQREPQLPPQQQQRQQQQPQQRQQQQPPSQSYKQQTERRPKNSFPSRITFSGQQQRHIDGDESAVPKKQPHRRFDTQTRTYADILKPKITRRPPHIQSRNTPPQQTTMIQKNHSSPRTDSLGGGIQDLLTNTQEAFMLLQRNFERLVDLKVTQMEEL